jgi:integrase
MPAKHLTDAFVRNVKLPKKHDHPNQIMYLDTTERGWALQLIVSYGGSKTFRAMRYVNGQPRSIKLGLYPQMSVKQARDLARAHFENPQKFADQAAVGSFKAVGDNWLKRHVEANQLISGDELRRHLDKYVYPKWKDRPFIEIRRRDVIELIERIADKNGRVQAERVFRTIGQVMKWHQSRDENYISVVVPGMNADRRLAKDRKRKRILNDDEIRAVWKSCEGVDYKFGAMIKLALLTAQRRDKINTMKWTDLDLKTGVWVIPVQHSREKGHAGALALSKSALAVVNSQPVFKGNPYLFPKSARGQWKANTKGSPVFNSWTERKNELDALLPKDMPHWTIHDLRRTARSLMSRAGVLSEHAERVMGHAIEGVEGVYDRYPYFVEKTDALTRLSGLIETILNPAPANVVSIVDRKPKK